MEQLLWDYAQKSIVAASFIYLLIYFVKLNSKMSDSFVSSLNEISSTLKEISTTLGNIDKRIAMLEEKVKQIEGVN